MQAIPVLRLLKLNFPSSEIYWWIEAGLVPLLEGDPDLSGIFYFQRRGWGTWNYWNQMCRTLAEIRRKRFDWVLDLQSLARSAAFAWLSNPELIVGLQDFREGAPAWHDISVPRASYETHAVDWYLSVLRKLNVPVHQNFCWIPKRHQVAETVDRKWGVAGKRWIVLIPGARWLNKRWPTEHFSDLINQLLLRHADLHFAVLGGKEDMELGNRIAGSAKSPCLNLAGQTTLPETIEWLRFSEVVVTNDTGPMHIGAALGKKVVALFGPTNPARTGPYGQQDHALQHSLPCVPCMRDYCTYPDPLACLKRITPERIIERISV